jgi:hypothetical protein
VEFRRLFLFHKLAEKERYHEAGTASAFGRMGSSCRDPILGEPAQSRMLGPCDMGE